MLDELTQRVKIAKRLDFNKNMIDWVIINNNGHNLN